MTTESGFERPDIAVTVDAAIFTVRGGEMMIALVERANEPFQGCWALPGGFVEVDEDLPVAAARELAEETGLEVDPGSLVQIGAYGAPGRDPRMRTVSVVYTAIVPDPGEPVGGSDAASCDWFTVSDVLEDGFELAFDHRQILKDAREAAGP